MSNGLSKLRVDTGRFLHDHNIVNPLKLCFIVDFWPVFYFRVRESLQSKTGIVASILRKVLLVFKPIVEGFSGCRIEYGARIGAGLLLHYSTGIIISGEAVIGENCTLFSQACVIHKANKKGQGAPAIGNNVELGSGCKIVGNVVVGDHTIVGANAVVLNDVPAYSIAVGIPARHFENNAGSDEYHERITK